jgi:hypothetical protein
LEYKKKKSEIIGWGLDFEAKYHLTAKHLSCCTEVQMGIFYLNGEKTAYFELECREEYFDV